MTDVYKLRVFIATWLCTDDQGQPMIWFIKHFNSFKFQSMEEAEKFILTFAYIHAVYHFEGFVEKDKNYRLPVDEFLKLYDDDKDLPLTLEQKIQEAIILNHLDATFIRLFKIFKSSRNLFREFVRMNIDRDVPSYKAYKYIQEKAMEYGFE